VPDKRLSAKNSLPTNVLSEGLCRVLPSAKALPRVMIALGKKFFVDGCFAEVSLPSAALGKGFAEGKVAFAALAEPDAFMSPGNFY